MKIYVIRHGETTGDVEDRFGGSYDDHLTEKGKSQLQQTATSLIGKNIEIILSSPLIRARESVEIINGQIAVPVEIIDGLRERHYGVLTGLTKVVAKERFPEVVESHKDPLYTDPEGESYEDFNARVISTFKDISARKYKTVAIVSHGGPIKTIYRFIGKELNRQLGDGEILELEI
jgi:broad specificity phosphatase PhoE